MANPPSKGQSGGKEQGNKKDNKAVDSLRDELELINAATTELQKLKRQLRQTKADLSAFKISNRKTIQRQIKGIELLERERSDCSAKLAVLKDAQKPPQAIHRLIGKYHQALQQLESVRRELQSAKAELQEKDKVRLRRYAKPSPLAPLPAAEPLASKPSQDRLDQVILQYNKILAKNTGIRFQLEEMMKTKEEFIRHYKQLQGERNLVRTAVDRLYEENTSLFQQREEFRLKLNLLREKLEATRVQGARDLNEYRRLLSNDEKLNAFLEQKNQGRPCMELISTTRSVISAQQVGDDQIVQKVVDEWRETLTAQVGHCNFDEIVQKYQHDLEQGYVLYGLIAQKNTEIDRLEDEISELEQNIEQARIQQQPGLAEMLLTDPTGSPSPPNKERPKAEETATLFISRIQAVLSLLELSNANLNDSSDLESACNQLMERVSQMVASVAEASSGNGNSNRSYYGPPLATSRSSNSSTDGSPGRKQKSLPTKN